MNRQEENVMSPDEESTLQNTEGDPLTDYSSMLQKDLAHYSAVEAAKKNKRENNIKTHSMSGIPTGGPKKYGRHHRHRTSLGDMFVSMGKGLGDIAGDMKTEIGDTFQEAIGKAESGDAYFLDMGMSRSFSILPEQLTQLVEETTGIILQKRGQQHEQQLPDEDSTDKQQQQQHEITEAAPLTFYGPYLALLGAVLAVSSNGTALYLLKGVPPSLKLYWRMTATAMVLSFFAFRSMVKTYGSLVPKLTPSQWITLTAAAFCYTGHGLLYINALEYTSIGNVVIGANSQAIFLILGKFFTGHEVLAMELGGVLVAFGGCILCSVDEAKDDTNGNTGSSAIFGDVLALCSGAMGVGYLTFAKAVRSHLPVTVFMFFVMFLGSLMVLTFMGLTHEQNITFSNDPHTGLFGWMTLQENHLEVLVYIALMCNVIGAMGFVRAMQFFDNIIISVATLLEPMIATIIAFVIGVGDLPGGMGWMGKFLVIMGTLGVVYPSIHSKDGMGH